MGTERCHPVMLKLGSQETADGRKEFPRIRLGISGRDG